MIVTTDDHTAMVELGMRWLPFGGPPPEQIMVTYGITADAFYQRILDYRGATAVPPELSAFARSQLRPRASRRTA
ncbi:hypothetical protein [Gordonia rubripertincta]|uniref:DUF3263 domain-containing protein n=2 Tax=Gordonia rubripertincta TaxID=36822 RepID=A0AAW6REM6_GORRU|nr:hypothetical protein [Gordonia rubripertincta]MDG6783227.1 hypothetical protein [Gordonia rubripertincta]NKY62990.1 hypothetical protein [Gordonia rubripertincta]GAB87135.1 hypothetical protein GORBP_095_00060 [Gordonia rubripertincta NBRC 101908]